MGGTLLLLTLLGLHVYTLYALEQVRDSANYAQESVDDIEGRVAELADELESISDRIDARGASDTLDSLMAGRDLAELRLTAEQASLEAGEARRRADEVADALCRASRYSECP